MKEDYFKISDWDKFGKTLLMWIGFFVFGLCDCIRGPSILDIRAVFDEDISSVSLIFTFFTMGSLTGCIFSSLALDRLKNYRFLMLGISTLLMGASTATLPYSFNLPMAYCVSLFSGFSSGQTMTGGNVLCANLWKGTRHCSSFVHANQFAWSLGAVLAPIIAQPFLISEPVKNLKYLNTSFVNTRLNSTDSLDYPIQTLFPALGGLCFVIFICFAAAHIHDNTESSQEEVKERGVNRDITQREEAFDNDVEPRRRIIAVTVIMACFLFLSIGSEVVFR